MATPSNEGQQLSHVRSTSKPRQAEANRERGTTVQDQANILGFLDYQESLTYEWTMPEV